MVPGDGYVYTALGGVGGAAMGLYGSRYGPAHLKNMAVSLSGNHYNQTFKQILHVK